jgi:hypothetical protein
MRLALAILSTLFLAGAGVATLTLYASDASGTPSAFQYETTTGPCGAPVNLVPPAITGTITVGTQLHTSTGTWTCGPTEFHFQWSVPTDVGNSFIGSDSPDITVFFKSDFFVRVSACNENGCGEASSCIRDNDRVTPADDQYGNPIIRCNPTTQ